MALWTSQNEREFRLALSVRQERDADLDGYFFDQSAVFLYVTRGSAPLDLVSNLVHEQGHALLADTPLGFLHMSLFEIAARAGEELYRIAVEPVLRLHVDSQRERERRNLELQHIETVGPRPLPARRAAKTEADELFSVAHQDLARAFSLGRAAELVPLFQRVQNRRRRLIAASRVCHEAVATAYQLTDHADTVARHREVAQQFLPKFGVLVDQTLSDENIHAHLRLKRQSLRGLYAEAYQLGQRIIAHGGDSADVTLGGILAHHFPYHACDLLDMGDEEFDLWVNSSRLGADARFRRLCERPELITAAAQKTWQDNSPLHALLEGHALVPLSAEETSYRRWHQRRIVEATLCRSLANRMRAPAMADTIPDDWTVVPFLAAPHPPPPVLLDDGRTFAAHDIEVDWLKADFIRAQKVGVVSRVLERLSPRPETI